MYKKLIPSSLFVRFILILVLPIIFAQSIAAYIFYNRHWYSVSKNMAYSLANDIQVSFKLEREEMPNPERRQVYSDLGLSVTSQPISFATDVQDSFNPDAEFLYKSLKKKLSLPTKIVFLDKHNYIKVDIYQNNRQYTFIADSKRVDNPTKYIFMMWMTGASLIFLLLSIIFARNQIRPIIKLARAADRFGKGQPTTNLKPEGASEIRKAYSAFLKMKERIERQISHRTEMLAGVSHDLRTPLTRMKLQLALSKDPEMHSMLDDIKDMEYMVNSYLDFARGDIKEQSKLVSFAKFLSRVLSYYKGYNITIKKTSNTKVLLKTEAMKRCFQNLLDNAFKYGDQVIINSYIDENDLYIEIHDNGPGIPENKREDVFKPFFRLDNSRSKETGGTGLGLAITKDIISNHGGQIYLDSSELLHGLKVVIMLPL